jgi:hypothetical protein
MQSAGHPVLVRSEGPREESPGPRQPGRGRQQRWLGHPFLTTAISSAASTTVTAVGRTPDQGPAAHDHPTRAAWIAGPAPTTANPG